MFRLGWETFVWALDLLVQNPVNDNGLNDTRRKQNLLIRNLNRESLTLSLSLCPTPRLPPICEITLLLFGLLNSNSRSPNRPGTTY